MAQSFPARGFGLNGKSIYMNVTQPKEVFCSFSVLATNGLGVTSVKSNGYVRNVFMHTSTTPASNNGALNPNPPVGYVLIQLYNNFNAFLGVQGSINAGPTGSTTQSLTAGSAYIISSLGTTTLAQWQAVGLPVGLVPAVGQSFIATATATIGGTGTVKVPGVSQNVSINVVGDPGTELSNLSQGSNGGAYLLLQLAAPTSSSVTTAIATAPVDGSVISLRMSFDGSTVSVDGI